jgi:aminopeptidase N
MVGVHYTNKYDEKQKGCVMVSYPGEGGYVYTNLNPYESNRVYPCFDQPDLKAKYNLSVIYPRQWSRAISNEPELLQKEFSKEGYRQYSKHHSEA